MLADAALPGQMKIILGDVLAYNFDSLFPQELRTEWSERPPPIHVVGNLPFNISTPLIIKWMRLMSEQSGFYQMGRVPLTLTFQKEVAERMIAPVLHYQRSRLSIICQNWCDVKIKFSMSGKNFLPVSNVEVSVVKFVPLVEPRIKVPFKVLEKFVRHLFHYRNKQIKHSIATLFPPDLKDLTHELFLQTGIEQELTPAMLSIEEIGALCTLYLDMCQENYGLFEYDFRAKKTIPRSLLKQIAASNELQPTSQL